MSLIGILKLTENFALGKVTQYRSGKVGHGYTEYNVGQELEIHDYDRGRYDIFIQEGIVKVLDHNRKETTWSAIEKQFRDEFIYPSQKPLIVQEIKPSTRAVKQNKLKIK